MSIVEVKVPQLSESVAEATMLTWKKKAGDAVAVDEILIEIETDKVVLEVPAPSAGVLAEIVQPDGATVVAEQLIARSTPKARLRPPRPQQRLPPPRRPPRHLPRQPLPPPPVARSRTWPCPPPPSCWPTTT
jgi:2-oxoglutarate dehydrogenase E2 component (dihydrolipoamide succinyltransferase)